MPCADTRLYQSQWPIRLKPTQRPQASLEKLPNMQCTKTLEKENVGEISMANSRKTFRAPNAPS